MEKIRRCYSCMCEISENSQYCTQCGFNYNKYMETRNTRALMPGTVLHERYLLGKVLGMGGFGITYIGFDMNLDIKIAIKEYFPSTHAVRNVDGTQRSTSQVIADYDSVEYRTGLKQFLQEARVIARFNKVPGIVSVTDYFEENKTGYYVMEFLPGTSLKQIVDRRDTPMNEREVIKILKPVILALREVHKEGIVHRDISPDNMVVDDKGKLTLIDFGAAKLNKIEESTSIQLKHGYAPLEQYSLDGEQGPWTDVYALCATIYYMIAHAKPMPANQRAMEDHLLSLEQLGLATQNFSDVVMQGLAVNYQRRFKNLDALVRAFYEDNKKPQTVQYIPPQPPPVYPVEPEQNSSSFGTKIAVFLCICCIVVAIVLILLILNS